jgi:hypothetical protein
MSVQPSAFVWASQNRSHSSRASAVSGKCDVASYQKPTIGVGLLCGMAILFSTESGDPATKTNEFPLAVHKSEFDGSALS